MIAAVALLVAGCGGSNDNGTGGNGGTGGTGGGDGGGARICPRPPAATPA